MNSPIRVMVNGAKGKMGHASVVAIGDDPELVCVGQCDKGDNMTQIIHDTSPQVVLDFTHPSVVFDHAMTMASMGIHSVIGTTGLTNDQLSKLDDMATKKQVAVLVCPNFAIGAVLMMQFAAQAARYLPQVEIIEYHHPKKADAPSGTAIKTVDTIHDQCPQINASLQTMKDTEYISGAKGGYYKGVPIHSVRMDGYIASQDVLLGGHGERLSIRHDSVHRDSFMPGVCLALKQSIYMTGLVYGLEAVLQNDQEKLS